jgi:hypothetical protein
LAFQKKHSLPKALTLSSNELYFLVPEICET